MDTDENLEELKTWTVPSFFKFREVMLPYIQSLELSSDDDYEEEPDEEEQPQP